MADSKTAFMSFLPSDGRAQPYPAERSGSSGRSGLRVIVAMVRVWVVRMDMDDRCVGVRVDVSFVRQGAARMLVLVVIVVMAMSVCVGDCDVRVRMVVPLPGQQRGGKDHQGESCEERPLR